MAKPPDNSDRQAPVNKQATGGKPATSKSVNDFLAKVAMMPSVKGADSRGRLLFGMDATASRRPTWDTACQIQGSMFQESAALGGLDVQLIYYRGFNELKKTPWVSSSKQLIPFMTGMHCLGGHTQLARLLRYAVAENKRKKLNALVFVGDCLEEAIDDVAMPAGELGLQGVPCFMFHEGHDAHAAAGFQDVARLTRGAYHAFDMGSAAQLRALLAAVAVYAAGGRRALEDYSKRQGGQVLRLVHQMK